MSSPYRTFRFDWLVDPDHTSTVLLPEDGDVEWLPYPIPPELGYGGFQKIELALNMSIFRGVHRFTPQAFGQLIPLAEVVVDFPEPTFMVQVLHGGPILHRESQPEIELMFSPGLDLFHLSEQLNVIPVLDGSHSTEMTCLTVGASVLNSLVGAEVADKLLKTLGLGTCPQVLVRPTPLSVSALLHGAINTRLTGSSRSLYCQARILDYLSALIDVVLAPEKRGEATEDAQERPRQVHDYLLASTGKLPTLHELARQFGCSTRRLNDEFQGEYGVSLYNFIMSHRLEEAHAAICETDIPLKRLAERLGYSHVSNFTAAFKKKFGYPPGRLRKQSYLESDLP